MKVYLAGPMTGIPQFNYPAFDEAVHRLRLMGWEVTSPAELDDPETRKMALTSTDGAPGSGSANGETWGDFLARDVKLLADTPLDAIVVLPGWERSRGARLETFVANRMAGRPILRYPDLEEIELPELVTAWSGDDNIIVGDVRYHDLVIA